jgi:hypothetical protein
VIIAPPPEIEVVVIWLNAMSQGDVLGLLFYPASCTCSAGMVAVKALAIITFP